MTLSVALLIVLGAIWLATLLLIWALCVAASGELSRQIEEQELGVVIPLRPSPIRPDDWLREGAKERARELRDEWERGRA